MPWRGLGLEIGVGTGRFAGPLGIEIGIDPSMTMLTYSIKRNVVGIRGDPQSSSIFFAKQMI